MDLCMNKNTSIDFYTSINNKNWRNTTMVKAHTNSEELYTAERIMLDNLPEHICGGYILDLGMGCGRTTPSLTSISKNYIGLDYSPEMVECSRKQFPNVKFIEGDACDLTQFDDNSFDLVFFSCNGIDYVSHKDRLRVLSETYRVLKNKGVFIFSSHNFAKQRVVNIRDIHLSYNPFRSIVRVLRYFIGMVKKLQIRKYEVHNENYAIINDPSNNVITLMTYYIKCKEQFTQLEKIGFKNIKAVNEEGTYIDRDTEDKGHYIYYSAFK
jgi:ubiquinone/menaquinone biosynthesis C-methylase UbiE